MRLADHIEQSRKGCDIGSKRPIDCTGHAVVWTGAERQATVAGLEAEYAAERGRNPNAATAITSHCNWD